MAIDRQATMAEKVINVTLEQAKAHQASVIILCCVAPDDAACSQPMEIDTAEKMRFQWMRWTPGILPNR